MFPKKHYFIGFRGKVNKDFCYCWHSHHFKDNNKCVFWRNLKLTTFTKGKSSRGSQYHRCSIYLISRPYISSCFCFCFKLTFQKNQFNFAHMLFLKVKCLTASPVMKQANFNDPDCQLLMVVSALICFVVINCGDPGTPKNGIRTVHRGFYYSGYVIYKCNRKYKLDGAPRIYCSRDGNWSKPKPRCLG